MSNRSRTEQIFGAYILTEFEPTERCPQCLRHHLGPLEADARHTISDEHRSGGEEQPVESTRGKEG